MYRNDFCIYYFKQICCETTILQTSIFLQSISRHMKISLKYAVWLKVCKIGKPLPAVTAFYVNITIKY